jgi:hypothetical protein
MMKVNADRIEKTRLAKEAVIKAKEEEIKRLAESESKPTYTRHHKQKMTRMEKTIQSVKALKGIDKPDERTQPPHRGSDPLLSPTKQKKKSKKPIILEMSSESESDAGSDSDSDGGQPVILVKTSKPKKAKTEPVKKNPDPVPKQTVCRFI